MAIHLEVKIDLDTIDHQELVKAFRTGVYGCEEFAEIYAEANTKDFLEHSFEENFTNIEMLVEAVCKQFNISIDELRSAEKRRELVMARSVCARAAQLIKGLELRNICQILNKHHGTISRLATKARQDEQLNILANAIVKGLS